LFYKEFFETLHNILKDMSEIADLEPVQKVETIDKQRSAAQEAVDMQQSAVRVLKFKMYKTSIILLYAVLPEVPTVSPFPYAYCIIFCLCG
jgi:hypothetical protein